MNNLYFVFTGKAWIEWETIKELKPDNLLLSYWYFRTTTINEVIEKLGYTPKKIIIDSGAWSAWNKGKNISIIDYMNFLDINKNIEGCEVSYVALDVIGDDELTKRYYDIMLYKGYEPIPVYHAGDAAAYLHYYVDSVLENGVIALGGTAGERSKERVRAWVQKIQTVYPKQKFHLLGSSSKKITDHCKLYSFDSSTWVMMAINGFPKEIKGNSREDKLERAKWQMNKLLGEYCNENCLN